MRIMLQSTAGKNRFSIMPPDNDLTHSQALVHETSPDSTRRALLHLNHRQRKTQPQFVFQINLDVMHAVLLKLHAPKIMNVGGVAFHLFQHKLDLRLRDYLLFVHAYKAGSLAKLTGTAAPAGPNAEPGII